MLGSDYGTSGSPSMNPETGRSYGPDFPKYTTADILAVQRLLVDNVGINQMKAVVDYACGGLLTFLWGGAHPDRMRALVPVAGVITRTTATEEIARIRGRFEDLPDWNGEHYYGHEKKTGCSTVSWRCGSSGSGCSASNSTLPTRRETRRSASAF